MILVTFVLNIFRWQDSRNVVKQIALISSSGIRPSTLLVSSLYQSVLVGHSGTFNIFISSCPTDYKNYKIWLNSASVKTNRRADSVILWLRFSWQQFSAEIANVFEFSQNWDIFCRFCRITRKTKIHRELNEHVVILYWFLNLADLVGINRAWL